MRNIVLLSFTGAVIILLQFYKDQVVDAQVMQSASYQIQSDSINIGGGFSTSSSYQLESTVGEVATGRSTSTSYGLNAGFQQMQEVYLSLSSPDNVVMTPSLGGLTGGESNGSTTVTAISDAPSGYVLTIEASQSPAMQSGANTIADYVPLGAAPDYAFSTDADEAHFAYSVSGDDIDSDFTSSGGVCGSGADEVLQCWDGLSTTARTISSRTSANQPNGSDTTLYFKVGVGGSVNQTPGTYTATTTLTLLSL